MPTRDPGTFTRPTLAAVSDRAVPQGLAGPTPVRNPKEDRLLAAHDGVCRQPLAHLLVEAGLHQTPSELRA